MDLLSCMACGGYSASRMPTPEALRDYYREYYKGTDRHVTFDRPERLALHIFRRAFPAVSKRRIDLLDFGGGDADMTRWIASRLVERGATGVRILLVDYNTDVPPPDSPRVSLDRVESLEGVEAAAFDLVLASAILEHIPRPRRDLIRLFHALRPGGVFYARTPSIVPLLKIAKRWRVPCDFTFPGHVHDLGQKFWASILSHLPLEHSMAVLDARPSLVETTFGKHPVRTVAAHLLKAPWRVLGRSYGLIGGWGGFFRRGDSH